MCPGWYTAGTRGHERRKRPARQPESNMTSVSDLKRRGRSVQEATEEVVSINRSIATSAACAVAPPSSCPPIGARQNQQLVVLGSKLANQVGTPHPAAAWEGAAAGCGSVHTA